MSQAGVLSISSGSLPPQVPTSFVTNSGTAIPVANILNVLGGNNISTAGAGNTVTINVSGTTNNAVQIGNSTGSLTSLTPATNGQVLIGSTGSAPIFGNLTSPDGSITFTTGAGTLSLQVAGGTTVGKTITGNSGGPLSPTAGNWNIFGNSSAAGSLPVTTTGSVSTLTINVQKSQAIAATDATKVGLSNFNSNQFSVDANGFVSIITGGFTWVDVTSATQTLAVETGYVTDRGAGVTYTLPATAPFGSIIKIVGKLGLGTIAQNANQQILLGSVSSTVGITGSFVSTNVGDSIELVATTGGASTIWRAQSVIGNWTIN